MSGVADGGPAFGHGAENGHCCGMTLRDYFAAQAISHLITIDDGSYPSDAEMAYLIADCMLEARKEVPA